MFGGFGGIMAAVTTIAGYAMQRRSNKRNRQYERRNIDFYERQLGVNAQIAAANMATINTVAGQKAIAVDFNVRKRLAEQRVAMAQADRDIRGTISFLTGETYGLGEVEKQQIRTMQKLQERQEAYNLERLDLAVQQQVNQSKEAIKTSHTKDVFNIGNVIGGLTSQWNASNPKSRLPFDAFNIFKGM